MTVNPNILVCPLDWGMGHATRCVPVIKELMDQGANVIIGADNRPLAFLRKEFPALRFLPFAGYRFSYPANSNMAFKMAVQAPQILLGIQKEKKALEKIIRRHAIHGIMSDNRFGLSTNLVPSVFITHQLSIKMPERLIFLEPLINRINRSFISKFNECWIPDFGHEPNLSGGLSHINPLPDHCYFIGPLSRFADPGSGEKVPVGDQYDPFDILVILSGPEPQRTILEKMIMAQLGKTIYRTAIISGKPELGEQSRQSGNLTIYPHLETDRLYRLIQKAGIIISRPGYSTIMDLTLTGKKAIFVPTPGQTEQEYLAQYYLEKKWFFSTSQKGFDLVSAIRESESFTGLTFALDKSSLQRRVHEFISRL